MVNRGRQLPKRNAHRVSHCIGTTDRQHRHLKPPTTESLNGRQISWLTGVETNVHVELPVGGIRLKVNGYRCGVEALRTCAGEEELTMQVISAAGEKSPRRVTGTQQRRMPVRIRSPSGVGERSGDPGRYLLLHHESYHIQSLTRGKYISHRATPVVSVVVGVVLVVVVRVEVP